MDLLEIKHQRFSTLLLDFYTCVSCGIVDRDRERMRYGYECPKCKVPGEGARSHFPFAAHSVVDLMQETYFLEPSKDEVYGQHHLSPQSNHQVAIVVFFCTLNEVLLEHLLVNLMLVQRIPDPVQDRLLLDNRGMHRRIEKVFRALTGDTWDKALEKASTEVEDLRAVSRFLREVTKLRNHFVHSGSRWTVSAKMPEDCLRNISPLATLYVALHNTFIPDFLARDDQLSNGASN